MSFCLGNILGPLTFRNADAPTYTPAKITIVAVEVAVLGAVAGLLAYYRWENARRDREAGVRGGNEEGGGRVEGRDGDEGAWADLTDRENRAFRYKY